MERQEYKAGKVEEKESIWKRRVSLLVTSESDWTLVRSLNLKLGARQHVENSQNKKQK